MRSTTTLILAAIFMISATPLLAGSIRAEGVIESSAGGFKFPDGTLQHTAVSSSVVGVEISSIPFTINQSGMYYLSSNLAMTSSGDAITVDADDVTIDLQGFALDGADVGTTGVAMVGRKNVEIRNGTIQRFEQQGVRENDIAGRGHRMIDLRLIENGLGGVVLSSTDNLLVRVTAIDNGGGSGIQGYEGTLVIQCVSRGNNDGVNVDAHSIVQNCVATDNIGTGILTHEDATVTGNAVSDNDNSGIRAGDGSTVSGNTSTNNNPDGRSNFGGISVGSNCLIRDNILVANTEANISVNGSGNAIEGNLLTGSDNGILFLASGNFYANNRASDNNTDYAETGLSQTDGGGNVSF